MIAADCEQRLVAPFTVQGACNRVVFETWLLFMFSTDPDSWTSGDARITLRLIMGAGLLP